MAKIKPYKLVNTGALEKSAFTTAQSFAAPITAINGIGTVSYTHLRAHET